MHETLKVALRAAEAVEAEKAAQLAKEDASRLLSEATKAVVDAADAAEESAQLAAAAVEKALASEATSKKRIRC